MADISLTASMRSNLLSLQQTQSLMDLTQERLSTGKKVNSAIDNPSSYYTAQSLTNRASDLSALLDSMGQGVQTIQAANEAIESITSFAQQAKSIANSARDIANNMKTKVSSSGKVEAGATAGSNGWVIEDSRADMSTTEITAGTYDGEVAAALVVDGKVYEFSYTSTGTNTDNANAIKAAIEGLGIDGLEVTVKSEKVTLTAEGKAVSIADLSKQTGFTGGATAVEVTKDTSTAANVSLTNATAKIDESTGKMVFEASEAAQTAGNQVQIATIGGAKDIFGSASGVIDTRVTDEEAIEQRNKYVDQFNEVLTQIDQIAKDAGYKGINLLQENDLKVIFNEDRSSFIEVKGVDGSSKGLGLEVVAKGGWNMDADIDATITQVEGAITNLRSIASDFGNNYSIVQTREDFTENLINVLEEGSDKLTLADMNEESANMLALQTRQQLAINSLSLASQASQSVLKLFG